MSVNVWQQLVLGSALPKVTTDNMPCSDWFDLVRNEYIAGVLARFPCSSAVEQPAVNRRVVGSNPTGGVSMFLVCVRPFKASHRHIEFR